jgi:riboflavin kinase/FMN adenylyltransferase
MQVKTEAIQWLQNEADLRELRRHLAGPLALTIGNFDGVHLGHQHLFTRLREWQKSQRDGLIALMTFRPHPVQVLFPERNHQQLFDQTDQKNQLEKQNVSWVYEQKFDQNFASLDKHSFLKRILGELLKPQCLIVGHDFSFATNRSGTIEDLRHYCRENEIAFDVAPAFQLSDLIVSTTQIRKFLLQGEVKLAKKFLGRAFYLKGCVVHGEARGRKIGFPTANLKCESPFFPKQGVYAGYLKIGSQRHAAVANLGTNPTFQQVEGGPLKVEVHVLNFNQDIYQQEVEFHFEHFLREERKFSGIDELKAQIQLDSKTAAELLQ